MPFLAKSRSRMTSCSPPWPRAEHLRHAGKRRREVAVLGDDAHAAGALGDQHPAIGKEGDRPGIGEAAGDGLDRQIVRRPVRRTAGTAAGRSKGNALAASNSGAATAAGNLMGRSPRAAHGCATDRQLCTAREDSNIATSPKSQKRRKNTNSHFPLRAVRHDGGEPTHRQQQQTDQQRDGERRRVAVGTEAEDVGARNSDRHGGGRDDRRQCERYGCDQLHQGNGPRLRDSAVCEGAALRRRALSILVISLSREFESVVVLVATIAGDAGVRSSGFGRRRECLVKEGLNSAGSIAFVVPCDPRRDSPQSHSAAPTRGGFDDENDLPVSSRVLSALLIAGGGAPC